MMMRTVTVLMAFALTLPVGCGDRGKAAKRIVVVVSPHGSEVLEAYEKKFEARYPDIDVRWMYMGTASCAARVRSERAQPQTDIWWGGPVTEFMAAEKEDLLAAYVPSWADRVADDARSPSGAWIVNWRTPAVIMYNTERVKKADRPRDWDDLLDPKWTGRIVIRDPLQSGTMKTIYGAMVLRAESEEKGFAWLRKLDRQNGGIYASKPEIMYLELKRGAGDLTLWNLADVLLQQRNGYPFDYVIPSSGTPVVMECIAIVKNAPHEQDARLFFEFVTSKEALIDQARAFDRIPVERTDIRPEDLPAWMTSQPIKAMEIDWAVFSVKSTEWLDYWKENIRGSGKP